MFLSVLLYYIIGAFGVVRHKTTAPCVYALFPCGKRAMLVSMTTTIRKTVDIPVDRRLYLELPQDMPTGSAEVIVRVPVTAAPQTDEFAPFPTMEELDKKAHEQYLAWKDSDIDPLIELRDSLNGRQIFGVDGVAYQRSIRDEWDC